MGDQSVETRQNDANVLKMNGATNSSKPITSDESVLTPSATSTSLPGKRDDSEEVEVPTPPDGGWGWMVVLGSFIIHIVADGMAYSFGVVNVYLLEDFEDAGRGDTGLIGAVMVGLTMGVGKCGLLNCLSLILYTCSDFLSSKRKIFL